MTLYCMRALVRFFFASVGFNVMQQEDGSILIAHDKHEGQAWRITVESLL